MKTKYLVLFLVLGFVGGCNTVEKEAAQAPTFGGCRTVAKGEVQPTTFVQQAIDLALIRYLSQPECGDSLIYRTVFTPGQSRRVGDKTIAIITRTDIPKGKEVKFVRVGTISARTSDGAPENPTIEIQLVTWSEIGQSGMIPMHAFPKYEMNKDAKGNLRIVKESLMVE